MEEFFKTAVSTLPAWLLWPLTAVALLYIVLSRSLAIWKDLHPSYRAYTRARMALELQKLFYEVEAAKNKAVVPDIRQDLPEELQGTQEIRTFLREIYERPKRASEREGVWGVHRPYYVLYGGLGGLVVSALPLISSGPELSYWSSTPILIGFVIYTAFNVSLGSLFVYSLRSRTAMEALLIGTAPALLIQTALNTLQTIN